MENHHCVDLKKVGDRIRNARKKKGFSQERAAEYAFISGQYWSAVERGDDRASVTTYMQIAFVLDLTLDDIFYDEAVNLRLRKAFSIEKMVEGCTVSEKAVISEAMLALKEILERNRS